MFDIETAPLKVYAWGTFDQNIALNQIECDWHLLSWAAKWVGKKRVMYMDQRHAKGVENDRAILRVLWKLLDAADVVVTQNGKKFDQKKVNARFIIHGMKPPSPYKHIDTMQLAKKHFAFTSNKLEYMSEKINKEFKKLKTKEFPGFELWRACLAGNARAWLEMERYNKRDVMATEELYKLLSAWGGTGVDLNVYRRGAIFRCQCGSGNLMARGFDYTKVGKFKKYRCKDCGAWPSDRSVNLLTKAKKKSLKGP